MNATKPVIPAIEKDLRLGTRRAARITVLAWVAAGALPLLLATIIARYAVNVPMSDEFVWAPLVVGLHNGTLTFDDLWSQHNEHRMFFGKLIALGLASMGGWSQVRECFASLAVCVIGQVFLFALLRATLPVRTAALLLVLDSLLLFGLAQDSNWLWGFQTAWFLINTSIFAMLWLLRAAPLSAPRLLAAAAFAYVASFSSAFGLNAWPAGLIVLVLSRGSRRWTVPAWCALGVLAGALYAYKFVHLPASADFDFHPSAGVVISYFLAYLGAPLGVWGGVFVSSLLGAVVLLAYLAAAAFALLPQNRFALRDAAPWIALGAYAICCAAMTTYGRAGLGPAEALASRYVTPATTLWIALISLGALAPVTVRFRPYYRIAAIVCLAGGAVLFGLASKTGFDEILGYSAAAQNDYQVARNFRSASDEQLRQLYPSPYLVRDYLSKLAAVGLGPAAVPGRAP